MEWNDHKVGAGGIAHPDPVPTPVMGINDEKT